MRGPPRIDFRAIALDVAKWKRVVARRGAACDVTKIVTAYKRYRDLSYIVQQLSRERNKATATGPDESGRQLRLQIGLLERDLALIGDELTDLSVDLPNDIHPDVPDTDTAIHEFGPGATATLTADHVEALEQAGWMCSEEAVKVAGRGFAVLKGTGALLEHALSNYAVQFAIKNGFTPVTVPDMVHADVVRAAGFSPRTTEDPVFRLASDDRVLAGTAEHPLLAMHKNARLKGEASVRYVATGHAFRREAGQYGSMGRGLYRLHQFTKVELFATSDPDRSDLVFEELCGVQLALIKSLGFAGRQLEMSARELGASAYRKRDIELWLPHSRRFGEVTSASNCTDYQARRVNLRLDDGRFAHTLNATAVAVPRIIQCIAEHGLAIPAVLQPHIDYLLPTRSKK